MNICQDNGVKLFSPHFINAEFAGYTISSESTEIYTDTSMSEMKKKIVKKESILDYILAFCNCGSTE